MLFSTWHSGHSSHTPGNAYFLCPEHIAQEERMTLAKTQHHRSFTQRSQIPLPCMLSAYQQSHWQEYEKLRKQLRGLDGSYLADLDQHPDYGSAGPILFTIVSHGRWLSWQKGLLSSADYLSSMGDLLGQSKHVSICQANHASCRLYFWMPCVSPSYFRAR